MSSVRRDIVRNLTRTFTVTQDANQGENGAYFFPDTSIDVWAAANASKISQIGSVYIIPGTATANAFVSVVNGQDGNARLGDGGGGVSVISDRKSLKDFGTEVIIGNLVEPRLLVLRRIQYYADSVHGGRSGDPSYTGLRFYWNF